MPKNNKPLIVIGLVCMATFALLAAIAILFSQQHMPDLDQEKFEAAQARWNRQTPPDYDIEIEVQGNQPATYRVQVRDGQATAAWRNGHPLQDPRTFATWSVPGMFRTIEFDIERLRKPSVEGQTIQLQAQFDPQWGYPASFHRVQWGSLVEVRWQVTQFKLSTPGS